MPYIVQTGTAFNGDLTVYGPFPCYDSALDAAENSKADSWEIITLNSPDSMAKDFAPL